MKTLSWERVEGWVEITINRPEKLNALRERTDEELLAVLAEVERLAGCLSRKLARARGKPRVP